VTLHQLAQDPGQDVHVQRPVQVQDGLELVPDVAGRSGGGTGGPPVSPPAPIIAAIPAAVRPA